MTQEGRSIPRFPTPSLSGDRPSGQHPGVIEDPASTLTLGAGSSPTSIATPEARMRQLYELIGQGACPDCGAFQMQANAKAASVECGVCGQRWSLELSPEAWEGASEHILQANDHSELDAGVPAAKKHL